MSYLEYKEILTFIEVETNGYKNSKSVVAQYDIPCIFVQNISFNNNSHQELIDADAICYPDPENEFIIDIANRLEGMYLRANVFNGDNDSSFYKIVSVNVNRDHLLGNVIDNIECRLKKSVSLGGVS